VKEKKEEKRNRYEGVRRREEKKVGRIRKKGREKSMKE
jgi:hypothetical protein